MKNNINIISENELNQLLNQAFLNLNFKEPKNKELMDTISHRVFSTPQEGFYNKLLDASKLKMILLISTFVILILIAVFYLNKFPNPIQVQKLNIPVSIDQSEHLNKTEEQNKTLTVEATTNQNPKTPIDKNLIAKIAAVTISNQKVNENNQLVDLHNYEQPILIATLPIEKKEVVDTAYVFPKLTEDEIKANNKQKKKMIDHVLKLNKTVYAILPTGTFTYKSEDISVQSFVMQTSEVSNLEYRTFLFDLLIENKKDEFLKAKPDQQQWMKEFNLPMFQTMVTNYFSNEAYNSYPVVNITREGAEMYCKWLTQEVNEICLEKNKPLVPDIRIPSDMEWMYAALGGIHNGIYPWGPTGINSSYTGTGKEYIKNKRGCFLANLSLKKYKENLDSIRFCTEKAFKNAYSTAGLMLGEGTFTAPVFAYNPNNYGLYCMSGNVSEMVNIWDTKQNQAIGIGSKGGSWNSDEEHLKIFSEDEFASKTSASPFLGFRPVFTYTVLKTKKIRAKF